MDADFSPTAKITMVRLGVYLSLVLLPEELEVLLEAAERQTCTCTCVQIVFRLVHIILGFNPFSDE